MPDPTRTPSSWRTALSRGTASHASRSAPGCAEDPVVTPLAALSFRDFAAVQIAAAIKGTSRDLSPRETAEVAFELALALEEERARRQPGERDGRGPREAEPLQGPEAGLAGHPPKSL
jgi:hypothetical protein